MLKKLLKYDILSMFPYYLMCAVICVGIAIVTRISFLFEADTSHGLETVVTVLSKAGSTILLVIACGAAMAVAAILPAVRFYRNLLRDEGYLMFTLPATPTELYFSKLLSALLGNLFMGLVVFTCFCIAVLTVPDAAKAIFNVLKEIPQALSDLSGSDGARVLIDGILLILFGLPVLLLGSVSTIFASLCLGQLSNRNKLLLSFAAFAGIGVVEGIVTSLFNSLSSALALSTRTSARPVDLLFLVQIFLSFLIMLACNAVSLWILNKKLNLE